MHVGERRFVNPYTFVPFPEDGVKRKRAPGHVVTETDARKRYSGSFTVRWQTLTELVLPRGQNWYDPGSGSVTIPGSSVKGAVRSVHETLFGGCPRVLTSSYVPVYRQAMVEDIVDQWRLAVVVAGENGVPTRVRLCEGNQVWIDSVALKRAYAADSPCTGDTIRFKGPGQQGFIEPPSEWDAGLKRHELPGPRQAWTIGRIDIVPRERAKWKPDEWVFLVTDVAARKTTRNQHHADHRPKKATIGGRVGDQSRQEVAACFWAADRLTDQTAEFSPEALASFAHVATGSRDSQENARAHRENPDAELSLFADVEWWTLQEGSSLRLDIEDISAQNRADPVVTKNDGHWEPKNPALWAPVAQRRRADVQLHPGDVIWVKCESHDNRNVVTDIKLAAAWRETPPQAQTLGDRVQSKPCMSDQRLCLSCAIFGSVDPEGEDAGRGGQTAYGGHVRFGTARITTDNVKQGVTLAPLSSPRPGAAAFYLSSRPLPYRTNGDRGDLPGRWGSKIDQDGGRSVRGRKFYWHSDPNEQVRQLPVAGGVPRYAKTGGDGFQSTVDLLQPGQVLEQVISFDGMDRLSLLSLLAAFDPARILPPDAPGGYATHLGGGKPFGLGAVTATIHDPQVRTVAARYTGEGEAEDPAAWRWSDDDRTTLAARVGDMERVHEAAAKVMARHGLGDDEELVSYPITTSWGNYNRPEFQRSFEFFQKSSGERLKDHEAPYVVLPDLNEVARGKTPTAKSGETNV